MDIFSRNSANTKIKKIGDQSRIDIFIIIQKAKEIITCISAKRVKKNFTLICRNKVCVISDPVFIIERSIAKKQQIFWATSRIRQIPVKIHFYKITNSHRVLCARRKFIENFISSKNCHLQIPLSVKRS